MWKGAWTAVTQGIGVKKGESVLIVTDTKMTRVAQQLYDAARKITKNVTMKITQPTTRDGEEPSKAVADAMKTVNVVIAPTYRSISHTKARRDASKRGVRIITLPNITEFSFTKGGLTADYYEIAKLCHKMKKALKGSKKINMASPSGTDVEFVTKGVRWFDNDRGLIFKKGEWGNMPAGEVGCGPAEGKTNGKIIFDVMEKEKNIELIIKNGFAVKISGSKNLLRNVNKLGKKSRNIAEFGIGANPKARVIGNILEDEKVYGTCHVALGNNLSYGGHTDVQFHQDGIILKPTVKVDGKVIIKNGKWLI
jgi:leucyl aminopeptidase (aminopeptidase T)